MKIDEKTHDEIVAYAGPGYAGIHRVEADNADLMNKDWASVDDLLEFITDFRDRNKDHEMSVRIDRFDGDCSQFELVATRDETSDEHDRRVGCLVSAVNARRRERQRNYERLKREFGV